MAGVAFKRHNRRLAAESGGPPATRLAYPVSGVAQLPRRNDTDFRAQCREAARSVWNDSTGSTAKQVDGAESPGWSEDR